MSSGRWPSSPRRGRGRRGGSARTPRWTRWSCAATASTTECCGSAQRPMPGTARATPGRRPWPSCERRRRPRRSLRFLSCQPRTTVLVPSDAPDRLSDEDVSRLPPVLIATGLCHSYGDRRVLDDLSLTVRVGERVAIVGENGAGKTTLMQICARLLAPQAGTLEIDGRVGYCPQIPGLHELLTPNEHLALVSPARGATPPARQDH